MFKEMIKLPHMVKEMTKTFSVDIIRVKGGE